GYIRQLPSERSGSPGDMCTAPPGDGAPALPGRSYRARPAGQSKPLRRRGAQAPRPPAAMRAAPRDVQNVNAVEITSKPIQVWLRRPHLEVTCRIVLPDGATMAVGVISLSLLDAQTEITSWLTARGYEPVSPWRARDGDGCSRERTFAQPDG